ncbi:AAA family ATPase [Pelagibacterium luteolum]|uniref:MoxR-like ATPase n=1 Tax=Pelagibacterium luteolum TaxID=440168 RepID=A0A1G7XYG0_9HYPH|nr:AAA family ATPase [Pelagibacterium luteolum]SDG89255.1 MoxR-like ATPase [Pelagibacterium luteolum]
MTPSTDIIADPDKLRGAIAAARAEMGKAVRGQDETILLILIGIICGGHVLLEGPPGTGKTLMVQSLHAATGLDFARIQFTPDLMPADITGGMTLVDDGNGHARVEYRPGPIFTQLLLADEINRATPRTQSALLEAMQDGAISHDGRTEALPQPFTVLATQNPIEMEGTYTLPEAQIDRFMLRINVGYPTPDVLAEILVATTGRERPDITTMLTAGQILTLRDLVRDMPVVSAIPLAVARLAGATQPGTPNADPEANKVLRYGISPRGAQSLLLSAKAHAFIVGRNHVAIDDLRAVLMPALLHRLQPRFEARVDPHAVAKLLTRLFDRHLGDL